MTRCLALLFFAALWFAPLQTRAQAQNQGQNQAQAADDALAALASPGFNTVREGIEALATSGHPRAQAIVAALQAGKLFAGPGKVLFVKNDDGTIAEATTGATADVPASALKPVRVNNAVRGAIDAALGVLRLFAPDPADRLAAAEAVFRSRDPVALPALERAMAAETNPKV